MVFSKMSKGKGFKPPPRPKSYYELVEVRQKLVNKEFLIYQNAIECALQDFGWQISDICDVYMMLRPNHFYKTEKSDKNSNRYIDVYKARLKGEDIYTHFYIDEDNNTLVINSFKRI